LTERRVLSLILFLSIATPFGQVPILEVDGRVLAQSNTIARYLARKHGLAGKGEWEQAQADMYADNINDLLNGTNEKQVLVLMNLLIIWEYF
jgi:glutathione S-transferase